MKRIISNRWLLLVPVFMLASAAAEAQIYVTVRPPRPRTVVVRPPAPGPNYVWIEEDWRTRGDRYEWGGGRWEARPDRFSEWVPGHWRHEGRGDVWIRGHWEGRGHGDHRGRRW